MGFWEHFPYTDYHKLNLNWLIAETAKTSKTVESVKAETADFIENFPKEIASVVEREIANGLDERNLEAIVKNTLASYDFVVNVKAPPSPLVACFGDGLTDDTEKLQNIINYASDNNAAVYLPSGVYMCTTLNVPGNSYIFAPKPEVSIIKKKAEHRSEFFTNLTGSNIVIKNITFHANSSAAYQYEHAVNVNECENIYFESCAFTGGSNKGNGINTMNCNSVVFHRCRAYGNLGSGFYIAQYSNGGMITDCISHNNGIHGFDIYNSVSMIVHSCRAESNGHDGYNLDQNLLLTLDGCITYGNLEDGVAMWGSTNSTVANVLAINCERSGFFFDDNDIKAPCSDITITGCQTFGCKQGLVTGDGDVKRLTFSNCLIHSSREYGASIKSPSITFTGCRFVDNCTSGVIDNAISVENDRCIITGCTFNSALGLQKTGVAFAVNSAKNLVVNNDFFECTTAVYGANDSTIVNNNITA